MDGLCKFITETFVGAIFLPRSLSRHVYNGENDLKLDLPMLPILYVLTGLAFVCVVITLVMGTVAMSQKSEASRKKSNDWMWRRIYAQVAAIGLLALTVYMRSKGA